ncbi:hypothetical protein [Cohnella sp. GCM10027633]|uniref:hypothetical protein n=1 Tax=unclassified Cohnella TaxID=2636738 RepID=UPI003640E656
METHALSYKPFNEKRPGSLVGTVIAALELVKSLYASAGNHGLPAEIAPCPACAGADIEPRRTIAPELSLKSGAVLLWAGTTCAPVERIKQLAKTIGIDAARPLSEQDPRYIEILTFGYDVEPITSVYKKKRTTVYYRGCVNDLRYMRDAGTKSKGNLKAIDYFSGPIDCPACGGTKLGPVSAAIELEGLSLGEAASLPIPALLRFVQGLRESPAIGGGVAGDVLGHLEPRLVYLNRIGLRSLIVAENAMAMSER